jgi:HD-GYP domain-containing protein (c-di-GMP phosphodiesterase class II)
MANSGVQHAQRLASLLAGRVHRPAAHDSEQAEEEVFGEMALLVSALLRDAGQIRLAVFDGAFCVGKYQFRIAPEPMVELCRLFQEKGVSGIVLKPGVSAHDLMVLARQLAQPLGGAAELVRGLSAAAVTSIEVRENDPLTGNYNEAVGTVRRLFGQIERGEPPDTAPLLAVAADLAAAALRDPAALLGLVMSKDYDSYSFHHSVNVGVLSMALSAALGHAPAEVEETGLAGFLHDVGKTRIAWEIVSKPGKLTDLEYQEMKRHPEYGALIISGLPGISERVAEAVLGHHIRYDRQGYPKWAQERSFNVMSSVVAVADCYDATTTLRAYQPQMQPMQAVEEIRKQSGSNLDRYIVERFLELTGRYPVGTLVRLDSNEIAVVFTPSTQPSGADTVKVVRDSSGAALTEPMLVNLAQSGGRIVDLVDPLQQRIDVSSCF